MSLEDRILRNLGPERAVLCWGQLLERLNYGLPNLLVATLESLVFLGREWSPFLAARLLKE